MSATFHKLLAKIAAGDEFTSTEMRDCSEDEKQMLRAAAQQAGYIAERYPPREVRLLFVPKKYARR